MYAPFRMYQIFLGLHETITVRRKGTPAKGIKLGGPDEASQVRASGLGFRWGHSPLQ